MPEITLESLAARLDGMERRLAQLESPDADPPGTTGDDQPNDPESVARWIAAFDAIPPLQMTPGEEAAWRADRETRKQTDAKRAEALAASLPGAAR